jgi:hypothetical protein
VLRGVGCGREISGKIYLTKWSSIYECDTKWSSIYGRCEGRIQIKFKDTCASPHGDALSRKELDSLICGLSGIKTF